MAVKKKSTDDEILETPRRSSRVPLAQPVLVTSMRPDAQFSEMCETLVVNAHGCSLRSPRQLDVGIPLHFHSQDGHQTMAYVVDCQPLSEQEGWQLAARLDRPENFWGLHPCPDDWAGIPESSLMGGQSLVPLPEAQLRNIIAEFVQPLHAQISELKERLGQRNKDERSRFEVSLSHIPPEVEEKLWVRLRQDLGAQVLQQTKEQSQQLLGAAKTVIEEKIGDAQKDYMQWVGQELQQVAQRAHGLSDNIADRVRQQLSTGTEDFQRHVAGAGAQLSKQSEELLHGLQRQMGEEQAGYRREMQQIQATSASETSRLQAQITELGLRVANLDDCARRLESDLEAGLKKVSGEIVSDARRQLEAAVEVVLKVLSTRNARELQGQLDAACGKLKTVQDGIEAWVVDSLRSQVGDTLRAFQQRIEETAEVSVGRWREGLARNLGSMAKMLGEKFRVEPDPKSNGEHPISVSHLARGSS